MSDEALLELVYHGREERNLEYKSSMSWQDTSTKAKIAKSAMAMANIPDGGAIVIGVVKKGETYDPRGMEQDHVSSFKQDDVMEHINQKYADPYVELTVRTVNKDNKQFIVVQVSEFGQLPIICKNDGLENLLRGAIFTRSRVKHETIQVRSQTEMREILDLAVDKEIRRLRSRGLITSVGAISNPNADRLLFQQQRMGL